MIPQIFFFKNFAWNLSVECVEHENVGSGWFSSKILPGFQVVCLLDTKYGTTIDCNTLY